LENAKNKKESTDVNIIMEVVKNGIESLGTSHYQNGYETDWKPFFSKEMVSDLSNHIQDELVEAHQKQLIVNADVYDIKLVELRESIAKAKFKLNNEGYENGIYFKDSYTCEVRLEQINQDWLISSFDI